MISTVPLDRLHLSELNVRKTDTDLDIAELADDIAAKGLLQNLLVVPSAEKRGHYAVVAGGRRLRALQLLVERGTIKSGHLIPVGHQKLEDGREVSLSENLHRVAMNAADEVQAFAEIVADYAAHGERDPDVQIARCARHFGVTERHVQERLRLAALDPLILGALRTGAISLDVAKAYAAYPDLALQRTVFANQERLGQHRVAAIRAELAGKVYRRGDRQVRYVGLDDYRAAGGRLELELFMGSEDEEVLLDTELLDRLCREKAEPAAQRMAQDAGFLDGLVAPWPGVFALPRTPAGYQFVANGQLFLSGADKAEAIAVLRIAEDGAGLQFAADCFRRLPVAAAAARPLVPAAGMLGAPPAHPERSRGTGESELDRLARIRRERIERRAVQLAVPSLKGTPLAGRTFYPADQRAVPPISTDDNGDVIVALLVRIPRADVDRRLPQAEREEDGLPVRHLDADDFDGDWSRVREASRAGRDPDEERTDEADPYDTPDHLSAPELEQVPA